MNVTAEKFELVWYFDAADERPVLRFMRRNPGARDEQSITTTHASLVQLYYPMSSRDERRIGASDVLHELQYELRKYLDKLVGYDSDA